MLIRITAAATSPVRVIVGARQPAVLPVGPVLDLDSIPGYEASEIVEALDNSHVVYEIAGEDSVPASVAAGDVGGAIATPAASDSLEDFEEGEFTPQEEEGDEAERLADLALLDGKVSDILAAVADFSPERLGRLVAAEQAGKTRKSLIEGIAALPQLQPPEGD